jgi:hypothetical protein
VRAVVVVDPAPEAGQDVAAAVCKDTVAAAAATLVVPVGAAEVEVAEAHL